MTALFQAALGGQAVPDGALGFEPLTRAARLILSSHGPQGGINAELERQADRWRSADLQVQQMGFDPGVGQVDLEEIPDAHLHEGPHESLIASPASAFPNISVMAYLVVPGQSPFDDRMQAGDLTLFVETMVKAGPVDPTNVAAVTAHETIVHRRIERTTEAIFAVLDRDRTMLGTVLPRTAPPRGGIGQQSWINSDGAAGQRYLWHGSRLQYTFQRAIKG